MNKMRSLTDREKSQKVIKQKILELKNTMNEIKTFHRENHNDQSEERSIKQRTSFESIQSKENNNSEEILQKL